MESWDLSTGGREERDEGREKGEKGEFGQRKR